MKRRSTHSNRRRNKKVVVEKMLEYAEDGEDTFNIRIKNIHGCWEESEEERRRTRKVQSFLERVEWVKGEKEGTGGTTWIEMYARYTIHGGRRKKRKKETGIQ